MLKTISSPDMQIKRAIDLGKDILERKRPTSVHSAIAKITPEKRRIKTLFKLHRSNADIHSAARANQWENFTFDSLLGFVYIPVHEFLHNVEQNA